MVPLTLSPGSGIREGEGARMPIAVLIKDTTGTYKFGGELALVRSPEGNILIDVVMVADLRLSLMLTPDAAGRLADKLEDMTTEGP